MQDLTIKKGYRFRAAGQPSFDLVDLADPSSLSFLPDKIPYIKPRLKVSEGDAVKIGSLLFEDKQYPHVKFLSPAGGVVRKIQFGPRRVIQAIVIERDPDQEGHVQFQHVPTDMLETMDRLELVDHILTGGLWWVFRQLPFRDLPDSQVPPPSIIVSLSDLEPYQPAPGVYLRNRLDMFDFGLKVLDKLAQGNVAVLSHGDTPLPEAVMGVLTHRVRGHYPADDPGTFLYHTKSSAQQNRSWFISGQDLLLLAQLLARGRYPVERIISVGGSFDNPRHFRTRLGVPLAHIFDTDTLDRDARLVVGGVFRGYESDRRGYMGHRETALHLLPQGDRAEFLALFNPGVRKPTYSRVFLSWLNPGKLTYDCNLHGGQRACVACLHCADVCPVDILPHLAYKAVLAEEVEEYLEHGLLDCVECGLCSYVCPSKIELTRVFLDTKAAYAKEQKA
jgi:Na+-transporting NADH:ubiquinone oxidoreductase subunit A